jgi:serine/threonine-protein kinase
MYNVDTPVMDGLLLGGRYRLGAMLGRGGMAEVYDGYDERLCRRVAVKLLRPEMAVAPGLRQRFETEARAAACLSHPNVVAIYDAGEDGGRTYIVMERLAGTTVADLIAGGPLDHRRLYQLAGEVLSGVGAAHAAGIIHRDLKPGNVLIANDGHFKVADFGIAMSAQDRQDYGSTATAVVIGTPEYLPPERLRGEPATPQSDLYAIGVILYEALTGRGPLPAGADPRVMAVIHQAMADDPVARFESAGAMARALDLGGSAAPPTQVLHLPPQKGRKRWPVLAGTLAVVLPVALLIALTSRGSSHANAPKAPLQTVPTVPAPPPDPTADALNGLADQLTSVDGTRSADLAAGLRQVASTPAPRVGAATMFLAQATYWYATGDLSPTAYQQAVVALGQAGGVLPAASTPTTRGHGDGNHGGKGNGGGGD